jgi:prepilin-type N-terminal cleavage/methylation domain-containing protein
MYKRLFNVSVFVQINKFATRSSGQSGMTLFELVIAIAMLAIFMLNATAAMQYFIQYYLGSNNFKESTGQQRSRLTDQAYLQMNLDYFSDLLAQPGFSNQELIGLSGPKNCSSNPFLGWKLPGDSNSNKPGPPTGASSDLQESQKSLYPPGYSYCLMPTSLVSTDTSIWILYAKPDSPSMTTIASRRIFCRPKPWC